MLFIMNSYREIRLPEMLSMSETGTEEARETAEYGAGREGEVGALSADKHRRIVDVSCP